LAQITSEILKIQHIGQPQGSVSETEKIYHLGKDLAFVYKQIVWANNVSFVGFTTLDTMQLPVPQQDFFVFGQDNTGKMVTVKVRLSGTQISAQLISENSAEQAGVQAPVKFYINTVVKK
jgi:hypothetical protein